MDTLMYAVVHVDGRYLCLKSVESETGLMFLSKDLSDARIYDTVYVARVIAQLYEGEVVPLHIDKEHKRFRLVYSETELAFINRT